MTRSRLCVLLALVGLFHGLGGCDKDRVQDAVEERIAKLSSKYDESKVHEHVEQFIEAVEERNKERLEELCKEQGNKEYTEVMDCYYTAFVIENDQGAAAARKYLAEQSADEDNGPGKATALKILTEYFDAKGTLLTREVAGLILIAGLKAQYPHVGGPIGKAVATKLKLIDESKLPK